MLFNSIQFLLFFPVVTLVFFLMPHRFRWAWLLGASAYFYAFFIPAYLWILIGTIIVDYIAGLLIGRSKTLYERRMWLGASLVANVGVLAVFKYGNFIAGNLNPELAQLGWAQIPLLKMALPIGLSFHTFQAMSYTLEVYHGRQEPERHLGHYALYVMFYPQLVAGPIERPQNILPQLNEEQHFDWDRFVSGLRLMLWGLFKKVVIADNIALIVETAYGQASRQPGWFLWLATYAFSVQIYCDFSGYSDIARGSARAMGFTLMENFRLPYFAQSVNEFWSRWHISLSTWFRDYIYIPLGGNRVSTSKWVRNTLIIFLISGLWHGADWKFVVWGGLHAFYLIFGRFTKSWRDAWTPGSPFLRVLITFHLVSLAWVFFRADSLEIAWVIMQKLALTPLEPWTAVRDTTSLNGYDPSMLGFRLMLFGVVSMFIVEALRLRGGRWSEAFRRPAFAIALLLAIILLGNSGGLHSFIYFQF